MLHASMTNATDLSFEGYYTMIIFEREVIEINLWMFYWFRNSI